jgi:hypothetical protein
MSIEAVMSVTLVAVASVAVAQLVVLSARQLGESEQERLATQEAANMLERLVARPWSELTTEGISSLTISPSAAESLSDPQLRIGIDDVMDETRVKRIRVELSWVNRAGERVAPIQLTAWKHSAEVAR